MSICPYCNAPTKESWEANCPICGEVETITQFVGDDPTHRTQKCTHCGFKTARCPALQKETQFVPKYK